MHQALHIFRTQLRTEGKWGLLPANHSLRFSSLLSPALMTLLYHVVLLSKARVYCPWLMTHGALHKTCIARDSWHHYIAPANLNSSTSTSSTCFGFHCCLADQLQQPQQLASPPDTPGGLSMAPPLEPPSTVKPLPAGGTRAARYPLAAAEDGSNRPQLSPFLRCVAHQMQLDSEVLNVSQRDCQFGTSKGFPHCKLMQQPLEMKLVK